MSKYNSIINTFKNGMVSPRLRGAIVTPEDQTSVEQLENFFVDRVGAACKRPGIRTESTSTYAANVQHYTFNLINRIGTSAPTEYVFTFNPNVNFNAVDASYNSTYLTISDSQMDVKTFGTGVQSKFITAHSYAGADITILIASGHGFIAGDVVFISGLVNTTNSPNGQQTITSVDATHIYYTHSAIPTGGSTIASDGAYVVKITTNPITNPSDLYLWNGHYDSAGTFIDSGLTTYLSTSLTILQAKQISDRSVVFTTDSFSFLVSILDFPTDNQIRRQMYMYPYFVSGNILATNLGKYRSNNVNCPIIPSNFPFNPVNTDSSLVVNVAVVANQMGAAPADGILTKSNEDLVWLVTIPKSITYMNGTTINLTGRFISIPTAATTEDAVWFLTKEYATASTTVTYYGIQCIGGTPSANATLWKLSTWGDSLHPRVVGYPFRRLMYGNVKSDPSVWWSAAIHPNNLLYKQGFMQTSLLQDASSNVSGINYAGATLASISVPTALTAVRDIFRFGFSDVVPSLGQISFIASRRLIHIGTSNGENQISVSEGTYNAASYSQNIVSTFKADLLNPAEGDRKIFYIANDGRDIRAISTENKDYESLDTLLSSPLEGLGLVFTKIEWIESLHGLICFTSTSRLFFLAVHTDTNIRAFSEIVSVKAILDFTGLRIYLRSGSTTYNGKMDISLTYPIHGDLYTYSVGSYPSFTDYYNTTVYVVIVPTTGIYTRYTFVVGAGPVTNADLIAQGLPSGATLTTETVYVYRDLETCKLKTLPIHEGPKYGSSVGDVQRVDRIAVLTDLSGNFYYGTTSATIMSAETLTTVAPYTKIVALDFPQSPDREQPIYIVSSECTPLNISGISLRGVSYSGE